MEVWWRLHLNYFDFHSGLLAAGLRALLDRFEFRYPVSSFGFRVSRLFHETWNSKLEAAKLTRNWKLVTAPPPLHLPSTSTRRDLV